MRPLRQTKVVPSAEITMQRESAEDDLSLHNKDKDADEDSADNIHTPTQGRRIRERPRDFSLDRACAFPNTSAVLEFLSA